MFKENCEGIFKADFSSFEDFKSKIIQPMADKIGARYEEKFKDYKDTEPLVKNNASIMSFKHCGQYKRFGGITCFDLYEVVFKNSAHIRCNRQQVQEILRQPTFLFKAGFLIMRYEDPKDRVWRFSYVTKSETVTKRYTYVLGKQCPARTAIEAFTKLYDKLDKHTSVQKIADAFSVEPVTDEFYKGRRGLPNWAKGEAENNKKNKKTYDFKDWQELYETRRTDFGYYQWYQLFQSYVVANKKNKEAFGGYFETCEDDRIIRNYVKKLLGRIVFLFFLQKKGWLGCDPNTTDWTSGDRHFMETLLAEYCKDPEHYDFTDENGIERKGFLDAVLEPLFFKCLNTDRKDNNDRFNTRVLGIKRIPFLNGGLFEEDKKLDPPVSRFDDNYFKGLFDFFNEYNFTIDENDQNDVEVSVDPEMLGKIFEGLLEDNKDKGAYYTPRQIVDYMCKESLIAYLATDDEAHKDVARGLVENHIAPDNLLAKLKKSWLKKLEDVKICDPAIGSGAFPMGLLKELFACRRALGDTTKSDELKKAIIQNNIYGVDIDAGAIDIARLRFWLSIVVDADVPEPLPNLDFKIMQGNSLLESYMGQDLSRIANDDKKTGGTSPQLELFVDSKRDYSKRDSHTIDYAKDLHNDTLKTTIEQYNSSANARPKILADILKIAHDCSVIEDYKDESKKYLKYIDDIADSRSLSELVNCYFYVNNHELRHLCRKAINRKINELFELARLDFAKVDASANDKFFLWHTWFKDVFGEDNTGGFDIVIGNPPYFLLEGNDLYKADSVIYECYAKIESIDKKTNKPKIVYNNRLDISCLFTEWAHQHIKASTGLSCLITTNKWMKAKYGADLRRLLVRHTNPLLLIDFPRIKIFKNVTVNVDILLYQNGENIDHVRSCTMTNDGFKDMNKYIKDNAVISLYKDSDGSSWTLLSNDMSLSVKQNSMQTDDSFVSIEHLSSPSHLPHIELDIKRKIEAVGKPLKDWDIKIRFGIKTARNDVFLIDGTKREEILNNCKNKAERERTDALIRPIIRGKDIKCYKTEWAGVYVILAKFDSHKYLEADYPAVYSYLLKYKDKLQARGQVKKTSSGKVRETGEYPGQHHWLELDNNPTDEYLDDFLKPKIVWKRIGSKLRFSYDDMGLFGLDSTCIMTGREVPTICAILNSYMGQYLLKDSPTTGTGDLIVSVQALEPILIPTIKCDKLLVYFNEQCKNYSNDNQKLINDIVYDAYGLSKAEREYVDVYTKRFR